MDVRVPGGYTAEPDREWPTIFFLHGGGGPENHLQVFAEVLADREEWPFVVLMPISGGDWVFERLEASLEEASAEYRIDADRLYLTGLSNGAYAGWELAAANPGRFAAAVLVAGGGNPRRACAMGDLPIWLIHNRDDPVIPVSESIRLAEALEDCDGDVRLTVREASNPNYHPHNAWSETFRSADFYDWLLQH